MIQCQFLNKLLDQKDATLLTTNNLTDEFFSDYKEEYKFIKHHIDQYGAVPDKATFLSRFPNFDIIEVTEPNDYLVDELYDDRNKRTLARIFNQVRDLLNAGKTDQAVKLYTTAADQVVKASHINSVDLFQDTSRYDAYVEKINNFDKYYVRTGFKELDEAIGGWDRKEELATIIARPGVGKTYSLLKVAAAAVEQGLVVGIYSGEMSENKVGYRLDTLMSHISNTKIIHGNGDIQVDYKRFLEDLRDKYSGTIKVLTPVMIGEAAGVSTLRSFIEKDHLDILLVDQHSLLEDDRHGRSPVEKAANISRDLKNLQVLTKIPIIAVSQQNRESTDNGVSVANVAQSDRIGQDSTVVLALEKKDAILSMHIIKARDGGDGKTLKYAVDFDKGIWTFIPTENDALNGEKCEELEQQFEYVDSTEQEGLF